VKDPFFFGYGSLVNRQTHSYEYALRARVRGWRRAWRHTHGRQVPFLTGVPCESSEIDGLVAMVPNADWASLDLREEGYQRHQVGDRLIVDADHPVQAQIYAVPEHSVIYPEMLAPILLSYLDVVVQGYLREFGEEGAQAFFDTTDGWDTPVRDDRAAPAYPRHTVLNAAERRFVETRLDDLGVRIVGD
tara:strand:+ start:4268 stop:4834 length:567 start_codon:yes stop_codon:yes gene_type:complete